MLEYDKGSVQRHRTSSQNYNVITWLVQKEDMESFFKIPTDMVDQQRDLPTSVQCMVSQSSIYKLNHYKDQQKRDLSSMKFFVTCQRSCKKNLVHSGWMVEINDHSACLHHFVYELKWNRKFHETEGDTSAKLIHPLSQAGCFCSTLSSCQSRVGRSALSKT